MGSELEKSRSSSSLLACRPRMFHCKIGVTEIAGVDNVARAKKQGLKTREWTSRHEEAAVDIASGQRGMKKQGWTTREWTRRHEETGVYNAGVSASVGETAERIFTKLSHVVDVRCCLRTY